MKFDVIVGNPPYGKDVKGSSRFLHYNLMNIALKYCSSKLCFIMPSKPITQQLGDPWYSMFKNAVCIDIEVVDKSTFKGTNMDNTAIFYCDKKANPEDYCKKLDVDNAIYNNMDDEGRLFIDGFKRYYESYSEHISSWRYKLDKVNTLENQMRVLNEKMSDGKYYLNVNRANGAMGAQWLSDILKNVDVLTKDEELDFCENIHTKFKSIIECPSKEYGENLKLLMVNGKVLRYGLWLVQRNQTIGDECYEYVPDIDYTNIHNDSELLTACGFTDDEIKIVLDYLETFDFSQNRNDVVRRSIKI